jgi:putative sterol carrier protein
MPDLKEVMKGMVGSFNPEAARGVDAVIQLNASGAGGGNYMITIKDGEADMDPGQADNPTVTINVSATDWIAITKGELDPTRAYMTGKLRLSGDIGLMMKFQRMFSQP